MIDRKLEAKKQVIRSELSRTGVYRTSAARYFADREKLECYVAAVEILGKFGDAPTAKIAGKLVAEGYSDPRLVAFFAAAQRACELTNLMIVSDGYTEIRPQPHAAFAAKLGRELLREADAVTEVPS